MIWRKLQLNWMYGLGEFAIVVLGVLAAFWVENWNSDRNDQILETRYIAALLEDLRKDDLALQFAMSEAEDNSALGRMLLKAIEEDSISVSPNEFVKAASRSDWMQNPSFTRVTFTDLMNTGNLRLIRSDSIRASISSYYTSIELGGVEQARREHQARMGRLTAEFLSLKFRDTYDYQLMGGPPWAAKGVDATDTDARAILDGMLARPEVRPAIEIMVRIQGLLYMQQMRTKDRLQGLIANLEGYLRTLEM
jgi:hypothetical protein